MRFGRIRAGLRVVVVVGGNGGFQALDASEIRVGAGGHGVVITVTVDISDHGVMASADAAAAPAPASPAFLINERRSMLLPPD